MSQRVEIGGLKVDQQIYDLEQNEIAPGTGVDPQAFWLALDEIVRDFGPKNIELLRRRAESNLCGS